MKKNLVAPACAALFSGLLACAGGPGPGSRVERAGTSAATTPALPGIAPVRAEAPLPEQRDAALWPGWDTCDRATFAGLLRPWKQDDFMRRLDEAALASLARALAQGGEPGVRAAVILATTRDPRAGEILVARLEARIPEGSRGLAGDSVAAAAFGSGANARDAAARLVDLATGPAPHPVLDVRVECAISSVILGRDEALPFLMDVVREGTSAAIANPSWRRIDWDDPRMQGLQDRAAEALSARAGIECTYRAGAPLALRESEVVRFDHLVHALERSR